MSLQSMGKSSNLRSKTVERPDINRRETSLEGPSLVLLSVVEEVAMSAPIAELKKAARTALLVYKTAQKIKETRDKVAYERRLSYDSNGFIATIWRSFKNAEDPQEWLSAEMQDILEDLSRTLEDISSFINERSSKRKTISAIFSRDDGVKINEYRKQLFNAMHRFKLQYHTNIKNVSIQVLKKNQNIEQMLHRNEEDKHALEISDGRDQEIVEKLQEAEWEISKLEQLEQVEINRQTEDQQWHSDELKKIEKEAKDRKSELERLRVAACACALEEANRLKKAEEEEIARLKRRIAAELEEDNRRRNKIRARSSEKRSLRQEDEEEEEEEERPARRSSKIKRNALGSPKRRPVASKDSTDDDEEDLQSSSSARARTARWNPSSTSLRFQETEYESPEEEDDYAPPPSRKSPKVKRNPQTLSRTHPLPHISEDLMAHFQEFMQMGPGSPHWSGSNSRSGSPMYIPGMHSNPYFPMRYGSFPLPTGHYVYGVGMPGAAGHKYDYDHYDHRDAAI